MTIRLLLADHQEVMRVGMRAIIARTSIEMQAEAESAAQLMRLLKKGLPQVVVLDLQFEGLDGLEVLKKLRAKWPQLPVLIWSNDDNPTHLARSLVLGAQGWLPRSAEREEVVAAIRTAAAGKEGWTAEQRERFTGTPVLPAGVHIHLTRRELQTLRLLGFGLSNAEMALAMGVGYETVKEHVQHVLQKLNVSGRVQAAVWAIQNGLA